MLLEEEARNEINERNRLRAESHMPLLDVDKEMARLRRVADSQIWKPHAYVLTERTRPEPIFIAAFCGIENLLRINFDLTKPRWTYARQALSRIPSKLDSDGQISAFGRPVGFVVNYTPTRAIKFDLEGRALQLLPKEYTPGCASLSIRGRNIPSEVMNGSSSC